jgi:YfiH family protein
MPFKTIDDLHCYVYDSFARHVSVTSVSTTRHTGVSPAPYDSLNLGKSTGDDPGNVSANREKLSLLTSHDSNALVTGEQVHGANVAMVSAADVGRRFESTDALITDEGEVALLILIADCAAVSLFDPIKKVIGLAHAGWRGTAAGIAAKTVERMMSEFGTDPTDLIAGIGPSIGPCCYEVGPDVVDRFYAEQPLVADHVLAPPGPTSALDRRMLNLWRANMLQLVTAGVFEANIEATGICTSCHTGDFYSHRAEAGRTGRSGALLMLHENTKRSY